MDLPVLIQFTLYWSFCCWYILQLRTLDLDLEQMDLDLESCSFSHLVDLRLGIGLEASGLGLGCC